MMKRVELQSVQTSNQGDIQYIFDDNTSFVYQTEQEAIDDYTQYFDNVDLSFLMKMLLMKNQIENLSLNACIMNENDTNGTWVYKQ